MAFTHQMTTGGALLRTTTSGEIQGECCCGDNTCTDGGNPVGSVKVTLSFAGGGTRTFLGQSFTSGQSRYLCPSSYVCGTAGTAQSEKWSLVAGGDEIRLNGRYVTAGPPTHVEQVYVKYNPYFLVARKGSFGGGSTYTYNNTNGITGWSLSTIGQNLTQMVVGPPIDDSSFGQIIANGVTITWERAFSEDWNTCSQTIP